MRTYGRGGALAEGRSDTRATVGWGAPHIGEFAWQAVAVERMKGIVVGLLASAKQRINDASSKGLGLFLNKKSP